MGVALPYAPGANYLNLLYCGLPFSQLLLAGMIWYTTRYRTGEVAEFGG